MKSLQDALAQTWLWSRLVKKYPELAHDPMPTIDAMVVEFLRIHDVFVKPVGSNINASAGSNALMGAVGGPMAVGINQALAAQAKGAALQEWTSWKQWALGHADWPSFKAAIEGKYQAELDRVTDCFSRPEIQGFIADLQKNASKRDHLVTSGIIAGLILAGLVVALLTKDEEQPTESPKMQEQSAVSDQAEQCRLIAQKAGEEAGNRYFIGARADTDKWAKMIFQRADGTRWETDYAC